MSTYRMLDSEALAEILDQQIADLQRHIIQRLGPRAFRVDLSAGTRDFLLRKGTSREYGARELKRTLHRNLTQPLAGLVARGEVKPGGAVRVEVNKRGDSLALRPCA